MILSPTATGAEGERTESGVVEGSFAGTSFEDVVLQNSSDFYRWLGELEAARSSETEGKFRRYNAALDGHLTTCDSLLAQVGAAAAALPLGQSGPAAVWVACSSTYAPPQLHMPPTEEPDLLHISTEPPPPSSSTSWSRWMRCWDCWSG